MKLYSAIWKLKGFPILACYHLRCGKKDKLENVPKVNKQMYKYF